MSSDYTFNFEWLLNFFSHYKDGAMIKLMQSEGTLVQTPGSAGCDVTQWGEGGITAYFIVQGQWHFSFSPVRMTPSRVCLAVTAFSFICYKNSSPFLDLNIKYVRDLRYSQSSVPKKRKKDLDLWARTTLVYFFFSVKTINILLKRFNIVS